VVVVVDDDDDDWCSSYMKKSMNFTRKSQFDSCRPL